MLTGLKDALRNWVGSPLVKYSYEDLEVATDGFRTEHLLGSGSTGSVFHGVLRGGTNVAVKVLKGTTNSSAFDEELKALSRIRHPNIVALLGWGEKGDWKCLVYELLQGGSIARRLWRCRQGRDSFSWQQRLRAARDASCGLSHIVNVEPKAFHRDIKPSNILLDEHGTAKVSDFGLVGTAAREASLMVEDISGTPGYICPIYYETGVVNENSEVFSFGIVLLELLVNKTAASYSANDCITYPLYNAIQHLEPGAFERVLANLDPSAGWPLAMACGVTQLALSCIAGPTERPAFELIVWELRGLWRLIEQEANGMGLPDIEWQQESVHTSSAISEDAASTIFEVLTEGKMSSIAPAADGSDVWWRQSSVEAAYERIVSELQDSWQVDEKEDSKPLLPTVPLVNDMGLRSFRWQWGSLRTSPVAGGESASTIWEVLAEGKMSSPTAREIDVSTSQCSVDEAYPFTGSVFSVLGRSLADFVKTSMDTCSCLDESPRGHIVTTEVAETEPLLNEDLMAAIDNYALGDDSNNKFLPKARTRSTSGKEGPNSASMTSKLTRCHPKDCLGTRIACEKNRLCRPAWTSKHATVNKSGLKGKNAVVLDTSNGTRPRSVAEQENSPNKTKSFTLAEARRIAGMKAAATKAPAPVNRSAVHNKTVKARVDSSNSRTAKTKPSSASAKAIAYPGRLPPKSRRFFPIGTQKSKSVSSAKDTSSPESAVDAHAWTTIGEVASCAVAPVSNQQTSGEKPAWRNSTKVAVG